MLFLFGASFQLWSWWNLVLSLLQQAQIRLSHYVYQTIKK